LLVPVRSRTRGRRPTSNNLVTPLEESI